MMELQQHDLVNVSEGTSGRFQYATVGRSLLGDGRNGTNLTDELLLSMFGQQSPANETVAFIVEGEVYATNPLSIILPMTIFYCFIFVAGIVGNLSICIVIAKNKSMHTATNYYLFNLAVSDFLLLVFGMPQEVYATWYPFSYPFNQIACIIMGLLSETAANATVLTITSFTVERYIAICHPFRSHTMSKLSRAIRFVVVIWLVAFGLATPQALQFGIVETDRTRLCTIKNHHFEHAFEVSSFLFFVGPMTVIAVLYVLIGIKLRKSKLLQGVKRASSDVPPRSVSGQTRVIRMLVAVVATFFFCWAPFHAQRLMAVYGTVTNTTNVFFYKVYTVLNYMSGILYFLSTCINPLLYNIMSHKFRDASAHTLKASCCNDTRPKLDSQQHTYSALSRYGVTGTGGSFKLATNMTCIAAGGGTDRGLGNVSTLGSARLSHQESNFSLLPSSDSYGKAVASHRGRLQRVDSQCISLSSSQSTTATNVSSNGKVDRANGKVRNVRNGSSQRDSGDSDTTGGGRLSTIAEKLRRGTKKVLAFSSPHKSSAAGAEKRKRHSCDSVDTNTISNSSLKEFDEDEFSSAELARFMAEVNSEIR